MSLLDMRTVLFSHALSSAVCALVMAFLWYQNGKRFAGMSLWLGNSVLQVASILLIAMRGSIPDFVSVVIGNTMAIAGAVVLYMGLERFVGKQGTQAQNYVLVALFALVHTYFSLVHPDLAARKLNFSLALLIVCFQCMWLMLRRVEPEMRRVTRSVGIVFSLYCVFNIARVISTSVLPQAGDFMKSDSMDALLVMVYQMLLVVLTFSLTLMVNGRLQMEVLSYGTEWERRYRETLENANLVAVQLDKDGTILFGNRFLALLTGWESHEIIGKNWFDLFIPGGIRESLKEVHAANIAGRTVQGDENPITTKNGTERQISWTNSQLLGTNGELIGMTYLGLDITERKRAEEALQESEGLFRKLFEDHAAVKLIIDPDTGNIIDANVAAAGFYGWTREQLRQMKIQEINTLSPEEIKQEMEKAKARKRTHFEFRHRRADGSIRDVDVFSSKIEAKGKDLLHSIVHDITERKRAEEAIRESEAQFREMADLLPQAVYETDTQGMLTYANRYAFDLFGYTREEFEQGLNVFQMMVPEDRDRAASAIQAILAGKPPIIDRKYRALRKDGTSFPVAIYSSPILYEGSTVGLRGIIVDMTEQEKAEGERERLQSQLHQAQKMEAIGTLAGGIAHDFNNLLMGIQGRASLILADMDSSNPHFEHVRGIEEYVRSAADLTSQLLGFARGGKYEVKVTDLNELADRSANLFGRTKKEITIHRKFQPDLWSVEVDRRQIEQVLLNLFVNAWQAMPAGGDIYLQTSNVVLDDASVRPHDLKSGEYVKISMTDTGVGMDEQTKQRLFDPFFTTKGMGRGTGLGLASAYGIIKNHNGIITVYSEKGRGSTFNIYLRACGKGVSEEKGIQGDLVKGKGTILLVDDEEMILEVGKPLLERLGYEVLVARSGKEAIEVYQRNMGRIEMVILDMVMPQMSGGETFDQLKAIDSGVMVLLSSGYSINGQAQEILNRGCHGFIQKPFNLMELSQRLGEVLGKR